MNEVPSVNIDVNNGTQPEGGWPADGGINAGVDDEVRIGQEAGDQDDAVVKESCQRVRTYHF